MLSTQVTDVVTFQIDYFGLQFPCKDGYLRWVDREKPLRKQLEKHHEGGARNAALFFNVQYYVTNVSKLEYEITRYSKPSGNKTLESNLY